MERNEAIERYILLRLRTEEINRLAFMVEGFHHGRIVLPANAPFSSADLKDTVRTAFFGWFATLTDKDGRAVYAFDSLTSLFPHRHVEIHKVQSECESCHRVLQRFRNNVAFHTRAEVAAQLNARRALRHEDTFLDLQSARIDFQRLMEKLISEELVSIPELPEVLSRFGIAHHPAFAKLCVSDANP